MCILFTLGIRYIKMVNVGDFILNKVHDYIGFVIWADKDKSVSIVLDRNPGAKSDVLKTEIENSLGHLRVEVLLEVDKIAATPALVEKTREYLKQVNSRKTIDNLFYIELMNKLNEDQLRSN